MSEIVPFVAVLLLMSGLFHIVPHLTRPTLFFGVTVAPEFRRTLEAQRILRRFRAILWSFTAVTVVLAAAARMEVAALLCLSAGFLFAMVSAHRQALAHAAVPDAIREVDLAAPAETFPGGPAVVLIPILFLGALALWAGLHLDRLAPRFPVHWGLHGADRWVTRTPAAVYGILALHATSCLLLVALAWGLLHWSRRISTSGAGAAAERRFRRRILQMLIAMEYLLVFPAWMALFQPAPVAMTVWGVALTAVMVAFSVSLIRSGQGGSRGRSALPAGDQTPDDCWKWGLIYINRADPAILIEKRFGIGYTLNLGNRWSWLVMALIVVPAAIALMFLR